MANIQSIITNGNGNVLIGTTTDNGYKLRIGGTLYTSGQVLLVGATNVIIKNHSDYPWFEGQSASAQLFYGRSGQNPWGIGADATYAFRLWDSSFVANYFGITVGGNVLIGTTTDNGDKLQVSGNTTINGSLYLRGGSRSIVGDGGDLLIDTENVVGRDILLQTQSGQNVGINTTTPSTKLEVNGGTIGNSIARFTTGSAGGGTRGVTITSNDSQVKLQVSDNAGSIGSWAFLNLNPDGGNVGIGTTSPDVKLSVAPSTDVSAKIGYAFIGKGTDAGLSGWAAFGNINMQAANQIALTQDGNGLTVLNAASGQNIRFRIANADKAIIDSSGNVGIGTTAPGSKLHVFDGTNTVVTIQAGNQPSVQLNTTDGLANAELFNSYGNVGLVGNLTSSNYIMYHYGGAGTLANQYTYFQTAGVERMRITGTGNVGIGTTSPDNVLDLGAASQGRALTWDNYSNVFSAYSSGNLVLAQNFYGDTATDTYKTSLTASYGAAGILISGTAAGLNGVMRFYVDNAAAKTAGAAFTPTERMQISGNGAIKFSTYGSGSFTGTVAYNLAVDSSGNIIETAGGVVDGSGTANYVSKWQDANTVTNSIIRDDGTTVGVGVAPAAAKLTVDGSITAGGQTNYGKSYGSIDTTGQAVAGLIASTNGQGSMFTFTCRGGGGEYQRVVYSCYNDGGTWYTNKVIDEGTNALDVTASANGATITFTFKARSTTQAYTPAVLVQQFGSAIDTSYL